MKRRDLMDVIQRADELARQIRQSLDAGQVPTAREQAATIRALAKPALDWWESDE